MIICFYQNWSDTSTPVFLYLDIFFSKTLYSELIALKNVSSGVSDQAKHKPACAATEAR